MTREQKIAEAKRLRAEGLTYRETGEALGVTQSCVQKWVKPEWAKAQMRKSNAKRGPAKRAWEAGECPRCGGRISDVRRRKVCRDCRNEEKRRAARERCERFIRMREDGLLNVEIAERENVDPMVVGKAFFNAKRYGLTVPPSPYWGRAK